MAARGLLVTLEGPDGSGKSTQASLLAQSLMARGWQVTVTREPGGTTVGEQIRRVLLDPAHPPLQPRTEALLFCAARSELVTEVVRPALAAGRVVVCDRYADSTLAYQGFGRGVPLAWLRELVRGATTGISPDVTVLLDLPVEMGLERRRAAGGEWNRMDDETIAFHARVRDGFLALAAAAPDRWAVVHADRDARAVGRDVWSAVEPALDAVAAHNSLP